MSHLARSINLANQISDKADQALADIELEMNLKKWPSEFRALMWDAIANLATIRAKQARGG